MNSKHSNFPPSISSEIITPLHRYPTLTDLETKTPTITSLNNQDPGVFTSKYRLLDTIIGKGSSCIVKKCINKSNNKEYAIKIINKKNLSNSDLRLLKREIIILHSIKTSNKYIINIYDYFETNRKIYIVLQLCNGNDLFNYIKTNMSRNNKKYYCNERHIAYIFYQIVRGVHECHKKRIVHRDLKPENILFTEKNKLNIVLTDFGLSFIGREKMETKCGSPNYVAPELLTDSTYTSKCDWWSCGVILYVLLSGMYPFQNRNITELYTSIMNAEYDFNHSSWKNISKEAKDLISKILVVDPTKRYAYNNILKHPFLKKHLH